MNEDNLDVAKWIQYALKDYTAAVKMVQLHRPIPIEIVCYHCQQAAEKILKAYAIAKDETPIKTHDLVILLNQCRQHSAAFDNCAKFCMTLTTYASLARYPSNIEITEQQMKQALKDIRGIITFMTPLLAEMGHVIKTQETQEARAVEVITETPRR